MLHYDPAGTARELTKAEKLAARDPILFGLLDGSRNLYFIGDWIDEQCNLTLEKIAELLGREVADDIGRDGRESRSRD